MASPFIYFRIPRESSELSFFALKYKELRLSGLKLNPTSFSSTYEAEVAFSDAVWVSRIMRPRMETFICAIAPEGKSVTTSVHDMLGSEWVAQVSLRGPLSEEEFILPPEAKQLAFKLNVEEEKWQMLSLYTLPSQRGKGLAKKLCAAVIDYLATYRTEPGIVRLRIIVKPENTAVIRMYENLNFIDAGRATLAEALRANGDDDLIPIDGGGVKYQSRGGVVMALEIARRV
jgi:ribosomal protein S18 acetylase RimI-like enzyme